jgi:hypothetical protein
LLWSELRCRWSPAASHATPRGRVVGRRRCPRASLPHLARSRPRLSRAGAFCRAGSSAGSCAGRYSLRLRRCRR